MGRIRQRGVKYDYDVGVGDPAQVIAHFVKDKNIEQIEMGSRGLSTIPGLLLGSVATKVIRLSEVPVLIVK